MYLGPGTGAMTIGGSAGTALAKICMKEHAADNVTVSEVSNRESKGDSKCTYNVFRTIFLLS